MAPRIRPATLDDAEGFVRAHERAWDASTAEIAGRRLGELLPLDARVERYRASFARLTGEAGALVAERDGEIVGVAVFAAGELRDLYVVPKAWGSDVAQALHAAALDALGSDGAAEAFLWVVEENSRARRFYEREGWQATTETRETPFGPSELRYRRDLP